MRRYFYFCVLVLLALVSCSEDTGTVGVFPDNEKVDFSQGAVYADTWSEVMSDVKANSSMPYLGCVYDPETKTAIRSSFATQFAIVEDYDLFPVKDDFLSRDALGNPVCDSVYLKLYFSEYYGDKSAPLKVSVYELKPQSLVEGTTYYTDSDLDQMKGALLGSQAVSLYNGVEGVDPDDSGASTYPSVCVYLDKGLGDRIVSAYYSNPSDFKDSYHFARNILPGVLVKVENGEGFMINVFTCGLYVCYKSRGSDGVEKSVHSNFPGTKEVIQTSQIEHEGLDRLVSEGADIGTRVKTPAGIYTAMSLPLSDIYEGEHASDSISRVEFILQRHVSIVQGDSYFDYPDYLLLLPADEYKEFFSDNKLPDDVTSFLGSYSQTYNAYEFTNIAPLVTRLKDKYRDSKCLWPGEAGYVSPVENLSDRWDEVMIIPVAVTIDQSSGSITAVEHDFSLTSARLVRGANLQIYYARIRQ